MIDRVVEFIRMLRTSGVRVSMSEAMDAADALRHIQIVDRALFKLSLRSALVKEYKDFSTFDDLFERFFTVRLTEPEHEQGPDDAEPESDDELKGRDTRGESPEGEETDPSSGDNQEEECTPPELRDTEGEDDSDADEQTAQEVEQLLARIQVGHDVTRERMESAQRLRRAGVEDVDLYQELPPGQVESLYDAVEELAESLVTRRSLRYRQARSGPVDIKRTVQKSFRTGNIPFYILRKRRKISKHELVVLCDISGSVWEVARFFLKLVQEMQTQFSRARSYLFVDRISEVTALFEDRPFDEIIEQLKEDPSLNFFGLSDFGRAFYQFYTEHLKTLSRDTVLVILGDARANWFDPLEWTLDEIHRRTHLVVWLNPEPVQYWDTDDSVMSRYRPYCDHVLECRNLEQLKRIGELILHS